MPAAELRVHERRHVVVKQGMENLFEMEDDEMDRVEQAADFQLNSRLGCRAVVKGDVVVNIPDREYRGIM